MAEMNERELLNAILFELRTVRAKVDATSDDLLHFRKEMTEFKNEMIEFKHEMTEFKHEMTEFKNEMTEFKHEMTDFRNETNNNFNKVDRRVRFNETDYDQLNQRVDKLELSANR